MSSPTNEDGKDCVIVTTTALVHSPKNKHRFLPRDDQNKKNTLITNETKNLEEVNSKNKFPNKNRINCRNVKSKKQSIILKPLICTKSSFPQKECKTLIKKPKRFTDSSINEEEGEIFIKKPRRISSSSYSTFPDLNIEIENKTKPISKSSLSSIFSSVSNHSVKEKYPQARQKATERENIENNEEEIDFVVRSPEPANRSIQSVDENILTVANIMANKLSTPKSTKSTKTSIDVEIIKKNKRLVREIYKHKSVNTFLESYQTLQPIINNDLIENSNDVILHSWERTGQSVPSERILRFKELLRCHENMAEENSQIFK